MEALPCFTMIWMFQITGMPMQTHFTVGKLCSFRSVLIAVFKYLTHLTSPEVLGGSSTDPVIVVLQVLIRLPSDRYNIGIKLEACGPADPRHPCVVWSRLSFSLLLSFIQTGQLLWGNPIDRGGVNICWWHARVIHLIFLLFSAPVIKWACHGQAVCLTCALFCGNLAGPVGRGTR